MSRSVCIIYGLNEGPAISKRLVQALERAGYVVTRNPSVADIIIGHSGGCYLIPPHNQAKTIVLIGLPLWPHRLWISATLLHLWDEAITHYRQHQLAEWVTKWLYRAYYAFNLKAAFAMGRNRKLAGPWNSAQPQIVIRNRRDEYSWPQIQSLPFNGPRKFVSLPGGHDDCWDHPERYINLLQSEHKGVGDAFRPNNSKTEPVTQRAG